MKLSINDFNKIRPIPKGRKDYSQNGIDKQIKTIEQTVKNLTNRLNVSNSKNDQLTLLDSISREFRKATDLYIKKLKSTNGAQYYQDGVGSTGTVFEHVIPLRQLLGFYLDGLFTFQQIIRMPTCRIKKLNNKRLSNRANDENTNPINFFRRYIGIIDVIIRRDGLEIDPNKDTYTLQKHIDYFKLTKL